MTEKQKQDFLKKLIKEDVQLIFGCGDIAIGFRHDKEMETGFLCYLMHNIHEITNCDWEQLKKRQPQTAKYRLRYEETIKTLEIFGLKLTITAEKDTATRLFGPRSFFLNGTEVAFWDYDEDSKTIKIIHI